ncbi:MAG: endonuclease MutS2 [Bacilli bacterium]
MQNIYEKFEFSKISEKVAGYARSEVGKALARSLTMIPEEEHLKEELARLEEMMFLLVRYGRLPLDVSSDLSRAVELAQKGGVLSIEDLEKAANDVLQEKSLLAFFRPITDSPLLLGYVANFPHLEFLEKDVHKVIAPDLSIFDNASPKLHSVRLSITHLENEMKKKLGFVLDQNKVFLSDTTLTIKNGHYVLPVANAYKNKVKGIVQDVSGSGETTFIEPEVLVELNNKMVELRNDERAEIRRLLAELSSEIASVAEPVLLNNRMIGYLDFVQAKALYADETKSHVARLEKAVTIDLTNARHPLIDPSKVVANDFKMDEKTALIVISGPNAGGKTVALKTLGVLVLMNQCGLAIPADEGATLSYFKHIYVDIGDSQSLSDNLSTFSGHMANIADILSSVGGRDLVLLDEVGTGTSPKEGEAIAFAVISYLIKKHAFTLISSHFEGLKAYALSHKEITNASMVFDEKKLLPTYKLKMGLPGESYGLVVAERFGIPEEVLQIARDYVNSHEETSVTEAIKKLGEVTKETEDEKAKVLAQETELAKKGAALAAQEASLRMRQDHYLSDVEAKKNEMLDGYREQMDEILKSVERNDVKLHEVISAKKQLEDLEEKAHEEHFTGLVKVGDYVNIPSLYSSGRVDEIRGNKVVVISKEGLSFKVRNDQVVVVEAPKEEPIAPMSGLKVDEMMMAKSVPLELNLIGQRAEEAELNLDKYLDECRLKGFKRVRIIHGWGAGVLREVVRDYAAAHKDFIASYEGADGAEGGGGATILHLK